MPRTQSYKAQVEPRRTCCLGSVAAVAQRKDQRGSVDLNSGFMSIFREPRFPRGLTATSLAGCLGCLNVEVTTEIDGTEFTALAGVPPFKLKLNL